MASIPDSLSTPATKRRRGQASVASALIVLAAALHTAAAQESSPAIRLTIDYGDGVQKTFTTLAWKEKMTVFDALQTAEQHPRSIRVSHVGSAETIFITAIDDLENEGAGQRNWRYTVNDQPARYSAGVAVLKNGDAVVWRFAR
jgi:hypothetical protein